MGSSVKRLVVTAAAMYVGGVAGAKATVNIVGEGTEAVVGAVVAGQEKLQHATELYVGKDKTGANRGRN